uniref:class B sortase n=1 Tax=Acetatifactor sp. TaxID=1872090 RepID=UPI004057BB47
MVAACILLIQQTIQNSHSEERLTELQESAEPTQAETEYTMEEPTQQEPSDILEESSDIPIENPEIAEESVEEPTAIPNPYADVFAAYEDIVGWLIVPDTNIDYPVVWTPEDENFYLRRDIDGNADTNGCLILDTDSSVDPISTNLIIHGHNMNSGAMFGHLADYASEDFCKEHTQITLYTEECRRNYEVIAVFRSEVYKKKDTVFKYYKFFHANSEEEFEDFYQNIKNLSLYDTGVTAEFGDRFITLSTCSYHVERGRFVVVAKEVECGDSYLPIEE